MYYYLLPSQNDIQASYVARQNLACTYYERVFFYYMPVLKSVLFFFLNIAHLA
jgi:hypothetical protein